ncbi:Serine hydroxymethyltransferase, cytosolic [Atta colombica]|uniref:Serine hydroxymethyltransferase n=1 Tax=Atta colombica TaxID=520822 RepID=A0A195BN64_9HYME|nr:Serine hydroxymethyltransferase, cytosolic [Atta colombica]
MAGNWSNLNRRGFQLVENLLCAWSPHIKDFVNQGGLADAGNLSYSQRYHLSTTCCIPERSMAAILNKSIWESDPELFDLIKKEKKRQESGLELIASENFTSLSVLQCMSSCLHNKYSEGLPGQRYYGGNEFIDEIELLAQKRALKAFNLDPEQWGCNVQPYSGSPANFAVYTGLLEPHERIMGLDLPDGGHLTHGFFTANKKISATSIFFESMPYKVDPASGLIDYDELAKHARLFKPKVIIAGVSCYSRCLNYKRFREIADENNAYLFSDMAHVSGLVATRLIPSPFEFSDVVSTTTHKTLRGPRAGVIFFRKGVRTTAMKQVKTPEFFEYQKQIVLNAKRLCAGLQERGYKISTNGTDVHMLLIDLRSSGITGSKAEKILEDISIACNKNTVPGDKSALNPSGIRLGTPAITTRGLIEKDIDKVVDFIDRGLKLSKEVTAISGPKLVDFKKILSTDENIKTKIAALKEEVEIFSRQFSIPGHETY